MKKTKDGVYIPPDEPKQENSKQKPVEWVDLSEKDISPKIKDLSVKEAVFSPIKPLKSEKDYDNFVKILPKEIVSDQKIKKEMDSIKEIRKKQDSDKKSILESRHKIIQFKNLIRHEHALDIKGIIRESKDNKNPHKTIMINMELRNGMHRHFLVVAETDSFEYEKGLYIIDNDFKYFDVDSKIYCLDYHQDCCLPIRRKFQFGMIKDQLAESDIEITNSINPYNLVDWMVNIVISKIVKGEEFQKWMDLMKIIAIITVAGVGFIILMLMLDSFMIFNILRMLTSAVKK